MLFVVLVCCPLQVFAHAQLRASEPSDGALLAEPPASIVLTFNETVAPLVLQHGGPDGTTSDLEGIAENARVTVAAPADLADGTHRLSWRVVSDDGHPVGGTLTFHVGAPSATPPTPAELAEGAARLGTALRTVLTTALVIAVGTAVFVALVLLAQPGPALVRSAVFAAGVTLPVGGLLLGVHGLDMLSLGPAALLTVQPWRAAVMAPIAVTIVLTAGAVGVAVLALRTASASLRKLLALSALSLAALSFGASGHAAVAQPRAAALPAISLHAATLIVWLGSLLPLLLALRGAGRDAVLRRFSAIAVPCVGVLVVSGVMLTWLQSGGPALLFGSSYGLVLAAKLTLVAALLALAARNRLVLTPALAAGRAGAAPRLRRAIRAEIVLGLAILALASSFRLTPPPRTLLTPAEPLYAHIHTARAMADIRLTPGRSGPVEVTLGFLDGDFGELVPKEVEVVFAGAGIEPIRLTALRGGDGLWHAGPVTLPRPGDWEVSLRLRTGDSEHVTLTDTLTLPD